MDISIAGILAGSLSVTCHVTFLSTWKQVVKELIQARGSNFYFLPVNNFLLHCRAAVVWTGGSHGAGAWIALLAACLQHLGSAVPSRICASFQVRGFASTQKLHLGHLKVVIFKNSRATKACVQDKAVTKLVFSR